jgi:tetratricopeptide (TPR) repeat protein
MEIEKNIFELLFQTGRALYELGRPEEALSYLNSAILENPAPGGMVYRCMGDCHLALGQPENAIKSYNTALKLRPDDAHSLSAVAFCYENENRNPEIALVFGENAVEIQPENGLYRHRLALMYMNRDLYNEALEQFEKALQYGHEASRNNIDAARDMAEQNIRQKKLSG